ncbi:hypothetical protein HID58_007650, partial [Brassica napus]
IKIQDQDHHSSSKMTMSTVHQQVLALPAAKTAPSGYFPDPASINKLQIPTFSKKSEQIKKKSLMRKKKTESFTNGARDQNNVTYPQPQVPWQAYSSSHQKKIAFCSERSIKVASPQGDLTRVHYKVSIPLSKINGVNQSVDTKKPSQKYLEVVTVDGFEFWFMGFLSNKKAFKFKIKITTQSSKMTMSTVHQQVLALPAAKTAPSGYLSDLASINKLHIPTSSKQIKGKSVLRKKKTESFTNGNRDQSKLGPKLTETVKRKLSLGAKIIQMGGLEKIYKRLFRVHEEEKLLKAYQCYLSTTAGPIAGLLFISSKKIAFCSERSIKVASPQGDNVRVHYKVSIPLCKINGLNQSVNTKKPSQKYLEVVTADGFEFWFMGFLSNKKAYNCLEQALCLSMEQ